MAQALKVGRYLSANPSATIEDLARFVLTDDKLPTETVMNWVAFFIKPSTELVDVGDMCETLGLDSGASAHSLRVKRNLWMLNDDQVTVVSVDSKTTYRVAASAMCEVISKLSGAGEARRILALLQEARRAYRTRLEKAGEPKAKKIKTHHMPVAAPSRTTSTPARQPRPAAPVTPAPATVQHEGAPRRSTRRFVTFMYASPSLVMAPKGGLVLCSHADVEAENEAVVKGLAVASYAEHGEQSYQHSTTAPVAVRPLVATRSNLQQVELEGCSVLHFAGHGIKEGALLFENHKMAGDLVHAQEVVKYFKTDKPRLVILLACHSTTMYVHLHIYD
ncbi:hypothetical protein SDRG_14650 [Saprolegnia diclina VS20]|uniref:CHAT domain-containing protein n=1 Tax=Saprolegnia diclina (strain VS20) TaxID=1156394 RepID=T0PZC4_SAPDV|nr:hypothetical protein SDRG_14650 [Saprolegnia diclina VS20]EQC27596.1 hypothetical protein SDRG_14650 [Saprolegnia diclina VS20]|eukprot:XP_008619016.1 hypothetical protein SDRG_14650 [Saprolegnia diclina VS20]